MWIVPAAPITDMAAEQSVLDRIEFHNTIRSSSESISGGLRPCMSPIPIDVVLPSEGSIDDRRSTRCGNRRREEWLGPPKVKNDRLLIRNGDLPDVLNKPLDYGRRREVEVKFAQER